MDIPTNDDGMFEALYQDTVVGHGHITDDDTVSFTMTDGAGKEAEVVMHRSEFEQIVATRLQHLTFRAAA